MHPQPHSKCLLREGDRSRNLSQTALLYSALPHPPLPSHNRLIMEYVTYYGTVLFLYNSFGDCPFTNRKSQTKFTKYNLKFVAAYTPRHSINEIELSLRVPYIYFISIFSITRTNSHNKGKLSIPIF